MLAMVDDEVQADVDPKEAKAEARRLARAEAKALAEFEAAEAAKAERKRMQAEARAEKAKAKERHRAEALGDMLGEIGHLLRTEKISVGTCYNLLERVVDVPEGETREHHEVEAVGFVKGIKQALLYGLQDEEEDV